MKQSRIHGAMFVASLLAVLVLATAPAFAHHLEDEGDTSVSSQGDSNQTDEPTESEVEHGVLLVKQHGKKMLQERRMGKQLKTIAQRQRTCQNIQKAVNNKLKAFNNHADKYLTRLNTLFTDVQTYQTEHGVTLANYDALVTAASAKQANAALAVATLKSLGIAVNCESSDPASMLSDVKEAAGNARDALKDYRKSVKALVVALVQAGKSTDSNNATEGED